MADHEAPINETHEVAGGQSRSTRVVQVKWHWSAFGGLSGAQVYAALALRSAVFVVEQACVFLDTDGHDAHAHHLLGFTDAGQEVLPALIAYLRVLEPGHKYAEPSIGRVITAPSHRGIGLGRVLMLEGLRRTRATYPGQPIRIGAQERLRGFYLGLGFTVASPSYLEDGIPHIEMLLDPDYVIRDASGL